MKQKLKRQLRVYDTDLQCDSIYEIEVKDYMIPQVTLEDMAQRLTYTLQDNYYTYKEDHNIGNFKEYNYDQMSELAELLITCAGPERDSYKEHTLRGDYRARILDILRWEDCNSRLIESVEYSLNAYFRNNMPKQGVMYVDIHAEADWKPGEFHESTESCWWTMTNYAQGRSQFRWMCRKGEAFALRYYTLNKNTDEFEPAGRCFAAKYSTGDWALFNAYGPNIVAFAEMLKAMVKVPYQIGNIDLNSYIYINEGTHVIFSRDPKRYYSQDGYRLYDDQWSDYEFDEPDFEEDYRGWNGEYASEFIATGRYCSVCHQVDYNRTISFPYYGSQRMRVCQECIERDSMVYVKYRDSYYPKSALRKATFQCYGVLYEDDWVGTYEFSCGRTCSSCNKVTILDQSYLDPFKCVECKGKHNERTTEIVDEGSRSKSTYKGFRYNIRTGE